jgi:hypothetical protein
MSNELVKENDSGIIPPDDIRGVWSGKLIDANGQQGMVEIRPNEDQGPSTLTIMLYMRDTEPPAFEDQILVDFDGQEMTLKPREPHEKGESIPISASLTVHDAENHARRAVIGQYVVEGESLIPLRSGVIVLWQYS